MAGGGREANPKGYVLYDSIYRRFGNDKIFQMEDRLDLDCQGLRMGQSRRE